MQQPENLDKIPPGVLFEQMREHSVELSKTTDSHVIVFYGDRIRESAILLKDVSARGHSAINEAQNSLSTSQTKIISDSGRSKVYSDLERLATSEKQLDRLDTSIQAIATEALRKRAGLKLPVMPEVEAKPTINKLKKKEDTQYRRALSDEEVLDLPFDSSRLVVGVDGQEVIIGIPAYFILSELAGLQSYKIRDLMRSVLRLDSEERITQDHERQFRTAVEQIKRIQKPGGKNIFVELGTGKQRRFERVGTYVLGSKFKHDPTT